MDKYFGLICGQAFWSNVWSSILVQYVVKSNVWSSILVQCVVNYFSQICGKVFLVQYVVKYFGPIMAKCLDSIL